MVATGARPARRCEGLATCTKPVQTARGQRLSSPDHGPGSQHPRASRRDVPAPATARGTPPPRLQPLLVLASAGARRSAAGSTATTWPRHRSPIPVLSGPVDVGRPPRRHDFMVEVRDVLREFDAYMANGSDAWFAPEPRRRPRRARSPTSAPSTASTSRSGSTRAASACWPATTARPTSDMALPFVAVGLLYRHGYFRQTIDADGHQEHAYPDYDLTRLPLSRVRPTTASRCQVQVELPGPQRPGRRLARPGRPGAGAAARHRHPRQRRRRPARSRTSSTSAAARCGSTRSSSSASAGCGRCGRSASSRRSGTSTRATRRSCSRSGPASYVATGEALDEALRPGPRRQRLHDPHAGLGRQRALRRGPRPARRGPAARGRRAAAHGRRPARPRARARDGRRRRRAPVRHDRVLAAPDARRERGEPAPRARPPTRRGDRSRRTADRRRHERRPHAQLGRPRDAARLWRRASAPTSTTSTREGGGGRFWERLDRDPDRRAVGDAPARRSWSWRSSPGAACATSSPATARRPACSTRSRRRSTRTS